MLSWCPLPYAPHSCPLETSSDQSIHLTWVHTPLTTTCPPPPMVITVQLFYSQIRAPLPFSLHLGGSVSYLSGFLEAPLCICPQVVLWISFKKWLYYMICHGIYSNKSFFYHMTKKKKELCTYIVAYICRNIDGINFQNSASALLG